MAHRTTIYARKVRQELIKKLGGKCVLCGENDLEKLEFDHINGRNYDPRKLSYSARLARYKREAAASPPPDSVVVRGLQPEGAKDKRQRPAYPQQRKCAAYGEVGLSRRLFRIHPITL
jgi:5-methylcytosine-specific restriction endonuclease McrA